MSKNHGHIFALLDLSNPCGFVLGHLVKELSLPRKELAENMQICVNQLSMYRRQDDVSFHPVSFDSGAGQRFVDVAVEALFSGEGRTFLTEAQLNQRARTARTMREAMGLLSLYRRPGTQDRGALFPLMAEMAPRPVLKLAYRLVGEAVLGPVPRNPGDTCPDGRTWFGPTPFARKIALRRRQADTLLDIDEDIERGRIATKEARNLVLAGDRKKALNAMIEAFEGVQGARTERDERLLADD